MTVIVVEPLITIKNCLPFKIKAEISSKLEKDAKLSKVLLTQETLQIAKFGKDSDIQMSIQAGSFKTNSYSLHASSPTKVQQELHFHFEDFKVPLDVFIPPQTQDHTKLMIIAAKSLVINQTGEKLIFFPEKDIKDFASFFSFKMEDGNEIIILDGVPSIKMRLDYENALLSDPIKLNAMGVTELDLFDGD